MTGQALAKRLLWTIETRLDEETRLSDLSAEIGVSPWHAARVFAATFGVPPMRYLRRPRLARALEMLSREGSHVKDVAAACGYGSQASFSRSFTAAFGVTPSAYRAGSTPTRIEETIVMTEADAKLPRPIRQESAPRRTLAGLTRTYTSETRAAIPGQWEEFVQRLPEIVGMRDAFSYGVCRTLPDGGRFDYACAVEIDARAVVPADFERIVLEPARYAIFEHRGPAWTMHETVLAIWDQSLAALGIAVTDAPDLEVYASDYDPRDERSRVEIWIPVKSETTT